MITLASVSRLCNETLLGQLSEVVTRDRVTTAEMLALIAEVDERKLYVPAGYAAMHLYCVHELRLSEDSAFKRIRAARAAKRFPTIFQAVADGRLNLSTVVLLTPHLTEQTADDLIAASANATKSEVEHLLVQRFPRTELIPMIEAIPAPRSSDQVAPLR